jgi:hypothetical protein
MTLMKPGAPRAAASRRGRVPVPTGPKDNTTQHSEMVRRIWSLSGQVPGLVLWKNPVIYGHIRGTDKPFTSGLAVGSSDLVGIVDYGGVGRFIGLEIKTGTGKAKPGQELWFALVRSKGGFAAVVHDEDEAKAAIQRAREGLFQ